MNSSSSSSRPSGQHECTRRRDQRPAAIGRTPLRSCPLRSSLTLIVLAVIYIYACAYVCAGRAAFLTQTVQLDDCIVKFEIWDTAGQVRACQHPPHTAMDSDTNDLPSAQMERRNPGIDGRYRRMSTSSAAVRSPRRASCAHPRSLASVNGFVLQERYRSLAPMYYRGAACALVVYDITSHVSSEGKRCVAAVRLATASWGACAHVQARVRRIRISLLMSGGSALCWPHGMRVCVCVRECRSRSWAPRPGQSPCARALQLRRAAARDRGFSACGD